MFFSPTNRAQGLSLHLAVVGIITLLLPLAIVSAGSTVRWSFEANGLPVAGDFASVALGDIDNDGKLDLVGGSGSNDGIGVWANVIPGTWSATGMSKGLPTAGSFGSLDLGDLNNDGKLDIVAGSVADEGIQAWTGDGTGNWTPYSGGLPNKGSFPVVALADLDYNGLRDVVAAAGAGIQGVRIYANSDSGWQEIGGPTTSGAYDAVAVGHIDDDGYFDIAAAQAGTNGGIEVWLGDGGGGWTASAGLAQSVDGYQNVAFGDFDADGKTDMIAAPLNGGLRAVRGDGLGGWLSASVGLPAQGSYGSVVLADMNLDGRLDIVAGAGEGHAGIEVWLRGAADWSFDPATAPTGTNVRRSVAVGDFSDDGLPDIAATSNVGLGLQTWLNTGARETLGTWRPFLSPSDSGTISSLSSADFNLDGNLDLVYFKSGSGLFAMLGDGGQSWSDCRLEDVAPAGDFRAVWSGRIRPESRYPDIVGAEWQSGNGVLHHFVNNGDCTWNDATIGAGDMRGLSLGDIDRDGAVEMVAARANDGMHLWRYLNGWSFLQKLPIVDNFYDSTLGDVNHDGKLDVVAAGDSGLYVWTYAGQGAWATRAVTTTSGSYPYHTLALGDINLDGHLDIVAGRNGTPANPNTGGLSIWLGSGTGNWTAISTMPAETSDFFAIDLADFDHDGKLDLLVAHGQTPGGLKVWSGDGAGDWTQAANGLPATGSFYAATFGHVDHDGNLDVLSAGASAGVGLYKSVESTPPQIWGFQPPGWITHTQSPTITMYVQDLGSGLDPASARCEYTTNHGNLALWTQTPVSPTISGQAGSTTPETMAVVAPFGQDGTDRNALRCFIGDLNGNEVRSDPFVVQIDTTPPPNPTPNWANHAIGAWTEDNLIEAQWPLVVDNASGIRGFSVLFSQSDSSPVDERVNTVFRYAYSPALDDGWWYILLRTQDNAGHWSPNTTLAGPYKIDTAPPTNPTSLWSTSHITTEWSTSGSIYVRWSGASDGDGSGVQGYSFLWDSSPSTMPDTTVDAAQNCGTTTPVPCTTSPALADGGHWFHLRTVDGLGHWTAPLHLGPFLIDNTDPTAWVEVLPYSVFTNTFTLNLFGHDNLSGIDQYHIQYRDMTTDGRWVDWPYATGLSSTSFTGEWGHHYQFRARARDSAGNEPLPWTDMDERDTETRIAVDLEVTAIEVTQGVQDMNQSMPLVAERTTTVRAYVKTNYGPVPGVTAELHAFANGVELAGSPNYASPQTIRIGSRARADADGTFDFTLFDFADPTWLNGNVTFRAVVNADAILYESVRANNSLTRTVAYSQTTYDALPTLNVVMVPLHLHDNGDPSSPGRVFPVNEPSLSTIANAVERYHPISRVTLWTYNTVLYSPLHPAFEWDLTDDEDANDVLVRLQTLDAFSEDPVPRVRYVGMVHPDIPANFSGLGSRPGFVSWVKMDASPASAGARGAWLDTRGGNTIAHELGHNSGLRHMPCAGNEESGGSIDPEYPWPAPDCRIASGDPNGYYGFDWRTDVEISNGDNDGTPGLDAFPMMGYQWPAWISPYEYCKLLNSYSIGCSLEFQTLLQQMEAAIEADPLAYADSAELSALQTAGRYLVVGGTIRVAGASARLRQVYAVDSLPADTIEKAGEKLGLNAVSALNAEPSYALVQLDAKGQIVRANSFFPDSTAHSGDVRSFFEVVPLLTDTVRFEIRQDEKVLAQRSASANPPTVQLLAPNSGQLSPGTEMKWSAFDPDLDDLSFDVLYSVNGGQSWRLIAMEVKGSSFTIPEGLPGSGEGRLRIVANDGFHTAHDDSDGLVSVAGSPPIPFIVQPAPGLTVAPGSRIWLQGAGTDPEDGPLSGQGLTWHSSRAGNLGTGEGVLMTMTLTGTHVFTLTATDRNGQAMSTSTTVFVGSSPPLVLTPRQDAKSGAPGAVVSHTLRITNTGDVADTFVLSGTGNFWPTTFPPSIGPLAPGSAASSEILVTIPPTATGDMRDEMVITVASLDKPAYTASSRLETFVLSETITTPTPTPTPQGATPTPTASATPTVPPRVTLSFQPPVAEVAAGEIVTLELRVDAGSQLISFVVAQVEFDPAYLEGVDASGKPAFEGVFIPGTKLPNVTCNQADNLGGWAVYCATMTASGPTMGSFSLASIRFRARVATHAGTLVRFRYSGDPNDNLSSSVGDASGDPVSASVQSSTLYINSDEGSLLGTVGLQGRGGTPGPRWVVPLTVALHAPAVITPTYRFTPTTDASGRFTATGILSGTYDIRVKKTHSLTNMRPNVMLHSGVNILDLRTLLEGDADDDGAVNSLDYAPLASAYFTFMGEPGFDGRVDFNQDSRVSAPDYAVLAANYLRSGDVLLPSAVSNQPSALAIAVPVAVRVELGKTGATVGEIVPFSVWIDAGSQQVSAVDIALTVDPDLVDLVDRNGNPVGLNAIELADALPIALGGRNSADNKTGTVELSAGVRQGGAPASGSFRLASGYLRAKAAASQTALRVYYRANAGSDPRNPAIVDPAGNALASTANEGVLRVRYGSYLPLVLRDYVGGW